MVRRTLPDQSYLRECFDYDPVAGVLYWRERPLSHFLDEWRWKIWNNRSAGKVAGFPRPDGYRCITIGNKQYIVHLIIWMLVEGYRPEHLIDHKNRDRTDNSWGNLREATRSQNQRNNARTGPSGLKGASLAKNNKFVALIKVDGKMRYLGTFATAEEAHAAYCAAARTLFGEFWYDGHS